VETLEERSLSFYEAQGFRIEGCGRITESGPRFWAMIRAPHRVNASAQVGRTV